MSTTVGPPKGTVQPASTAPGVGARWAAQFTALHFAYALTLGGLFLYFNYLPLFHTDLWGHVVFGDWILQHRALPTEDPWQPLAAGMPLVDSAWLGQVVLAAVHKLAGPAGLAVLFALLMAAAYALLARAAVLITGYGWAGLACVALVVTIGWSRLMTQRPEVLGSVCFAAVLWLSVVIDRALGGDAHLGREGPQEVESPSSSEQSQAACGKRIPIWIWVLLPLVMMLWANMHGSFVCGLGMLACLGGGEIVDAAWRLRSPRAVLADARVRQWVLLAELSAAATLVNPYGIDLWIEVLRFSANENLRDITEWYPLVLASPTGMQFALAWLACVVLVRISPLRIRTAEVMAWGLFSFLVATSLRMIGWFSMVASLLLIRHLGGTIAHVLARRQRARRVAVCPETIASTHPETIPPMSAERLPTVPSETLPSMRPEEVPSMGSEAIPAMRPESLPAVCSQALQPAQAASEAGLAADAPAAPAAAGHWYWCAATLFVVWVVFALSDLARPLLGGPPRSESKLYSRQTPIALVAWLRDNPPRGQVFNPQWWGDWLAYRGPAGIKLFVTTHVHLIPARVYRDYTRIATLRDGWDETLARYNVTTVIVDKQLMQPLSAAMRQKNGWSLRYEDDLAAVFVRQGPRSINGTAGAAPARTGETSGG